MQHQEYFLVVFGSVAVIFAVAVLVARLSAIEKRFAAMPDVATVKTAEYPSPELLHSISILQLQVFTLNSKIEVLSEMLKASVKDFIQPKEGENESGN